MKLPESKDQIFPTEVECLEILRSKEYQFESTIKETMRVRDEALVMVEKLERVLESYACDVGDHYLGKDEEGRDEFANYKPNKAKQALLDLAAWKQKVRG